MTEQTFYMVRNLMTHLVLYWTHYGECSGLKLKEGEKEACQLGSSYCNHEFLNIHVNKPIKILVIIFIIFVYDQHQN